MGSPPDPHPTSPDDRSFDDLGPLQREIVSAVWMMNQASVNHVRDHLALHGRELAYTTVLSAMQKLEKAGWLTHRTDGRTYLYRTVRSRRREQRKSLNRVLRQLFAGDRQLLLQQLLSEGKLSREEARSLTDLIRDHSRRHDDD